jgi:hypothetical protein
VRHLAAGALVALAGSLAAAVAPAAAQAAEYTTYVGCGRTASTPSSHECELGDPVGAFFESDEEVEYDICVEFPETELLCRDGELAQAGVLYVNGIATDQPGTHRVHWYLTGTEEEIGSWSFDVKEPAPPPAPPPTPPGTVTIQVPASVPIPVVLPPRESSACASARRRVRRLRKRLRHADPGKRPALRGKLGRARAAVRRAC